jgi:hypothetical protein
VPEDYYEVAAHWQQHGDQRLVVVPAGHVTTITLAPAARRALTGRVRNSRGRGLRWVRLVVTDRLHETFVYTEDDGTFRHEVLPGPVRIAWHHDLPYQRYEARLTIDSGTDDVLHDVVLLDRPAIVGEVVDEAGEPLPGVNVTLQPPGGRAWSLEQMMRHTTWTDREGRFRLVPWDQSAYQLLLSGAGVDAWQAGFATAGGPDLRVVVPATHVRAARSPARMLREWLGDR